MSTDLNIIIGGQADLPGWKSINIDPELKPDYVSDVTNLNFLNDLSVSKFYMSHVFEHIRQSDIIPTLKTIFNKLKPGGEVYISVPDIGILANLLNSIELNIDQKVHVMRMIYGGQVNAYDFHYFGYNFQILEAILGASGFDKVRKVSEFSLFKDTSTFKPYFNINISLNVICNRPI